MKIILCKASEILLLTTIFEVFTRSPTETLSAVILLNSVLVIPSTLVISLPPKSIETFRFAGKRETFLLGEVRLFNTLSLSL